MSRQADTFGDEKSDKVEVQGSEVQGSGRLFFALAKIIVDLIDDELTVSDAHNFAGKKVDKVKRALRVGAGLVNKVSNADERMLGGCNNNVSGDNCCYYWEALRLLPFSCN